MRFVPNVDEQFQLLTERADALGFHRRNTPNPSACRHYQALQRVDAADGTPYFLITRSGNTPDIPWLPDELACDDSPDEKRNGNLIVVKMGSRPKDRERLHSNRLVKGVNVDFTPPPAADEAVTYFSVVEGGLVEHGDTDPLLPKVFQHPGGMQVLGHALVMASEHPRPYPEGCAPCLLFPPDNHPAACDPCFDYERASTPSVIMFFDVSDPESPVFKSKFAPQDEDGHYLAGCDGIALTRLPSNRYLIAVTGGFDAAGPLYFYRSLPLGDCSDPSVDCTPTNPALTWEFVGQRNLPSPAPEDAHQSLHFFREGDIHGALFLAGARGNPSPLVSDHDRIDLFQVSAETEDFAPGEVIDISYVRHGRRITPRPSTGSVDEIASLAAATGFHETPSGELLFYAAQHDNDGPSGSTNFGEWRHIDMVRAGSPTLLPSAVVNGPYEVDEGSSVTLNGSAGPPINRAWIELFNQVDYGGTDFSALYPAVTFGDHTLDDFDDFSILECQNQLGGPVSLFVPCPSTLPNVTRTFTHKDSARSIKLFAPPGCSIVVTDRRSSGPAETRTFLGDGAVQNFPSLAGVRNDSDTGDINANLDAVAFGAGCEAYYSAPVSLHWDLDVNGTFDSSGSPVSFSAATFDGPSVVEVPAEARHSFGGAPGTAVATVTVKNVAPTLSPLSAIDSSGNAVNVAVPFVLTGLPTGVSATFTDPGQLDHQTASIDWGDSAIDPQSSFTSFDQAFGDGTGSFGHLHTYVASGTYSVVTTVTDDDGGADSESITVRVLTPEQAVQELIAMLDAIIATTTDRAILRDLRAARAALAGSNPQSNNGALNMIRKGNEKSAASSCLVAFNSLGKAETDGATGLTTMKAILVQLQAALSRP